MIAREGKNKKNLFENPADMYNWYISNLSIKNYFESKNQLKLF